MNTELCLITDQLFQYMAISFSIITVIIWLLNFGNVYGDSDMAENLQYEPDSYHR